jgi:RNA polymerase sigma-70 factor (ECF subfamily)
VGSRWRAPRKADAKLKPREEIAVSTEFRDEVMALLPNLRGYALILTRSTQDADDLLQDVLLRAWKYRDGFAPGTNLKAWLFRILRNEFLSHARRRPPWAYSLDAPDAIEPGREPEQEWRRLYRELLNGLDQLPFDLREALLLVGASGFSYEEAAQACGCAEGTVKSRVSRARDRLARIIDYNLPVRGRAAAASKRAPRAIHPGPRPAAADLAASL